MTTDEKLDALIAGQERLTQGHEQLRGNIADGFADLSRIVMRQEERLDRHEGVLERIVDQLDRHGVLLERIDLHLSRLDSSHTLLSHLYAQTAGRMDLLEQQRVAQRLAALESRVDALEPR